MALAAGRSEPVAPTGLEAELEAAAVSQAERPPAVHGYTDRVG